MTAPVDLSLLRWGIATASLGMNPRHTLEEKFAAIKSAGFSNCELSFADYFQWVYQQEPDLARGSGRVDWLEGFEPDPYESKIWETVFAKVEDLKTLAGSFGLTILMLQPLNQFDGWHHGTERHQWARAKGARWLDLCSAFGVEMVQVGSNDLAEADADDGQVAKDMYWLAEYASKLPNPVKIAYECWCFSRRPISDWEYTWKIVQLADHPNLGLCLDSGQFPLAPRYGWDPTTGQGWTEADTNGVIHRLKQLPAEKIFYVEISDCIQPVIPLGQGSPYDAWRNSTQHPRGDNFIWAASARCVPLVGRDAGKSVTQPHDMGGARAVEFLSAIMSTGYKGPLMFEVFEAPTMERDDPAIPYDYAAACALSKSRLCDAMQDV